MHRKKGSPEFEEFLQGEEIENLYYIRGVTSDEVSVRDRRLYVINLIVPEKPKQESKPGMKEKRINKVFSKNPLLRMFADKATLQKKIKYYGAFSFSRNPDKRGRGAKEKDLLGLYVQNLLDHPKISEVLTPEERLKPTGEILNILDERAEQITDKVRAKIRVILHKYRGQVPEGLTTDKVLQVVEKAKKSVCGKIYKGFINKNGEWVGKNPPEKKDLQPVTVQGFEFNEQDNLKTIEKSLIQAIETYNSEKGEFAAWFKTILWQDYTDLKRAYIKDAHKGPRLKSPQDLKEVLSKIPDNYKKEIPIKLEKFNKTEREYLKVVLFTDGVRVTDKEIADRLGVTDRTIRNIKARLRNNTEIVNISRKRKD